MVILVFTCMTEHNTAPGSPATDSWTLANAKARLSEVIDRAQAGPQIITRHGKPNAVIVSAEEWARKTARKGTLAEFLLASPLRSADLELERAPDALHDKMP
ncbi:prevent-host-death family protein [Bradyrhizobium sp. LB8.2]